jgi:Ca-activated chloride channel homolog
MEVSLKKIRSKSIKSRKCNFEQAIIKKIRGNLKMKKIVVILIAIFVLGCGTTHDTYLDENIEKYGEESYNKVGENNFLDVENNPESYFKADSDTFAYTNIRRFIMQQYIAPPVSAVNIESMINYFSYNYKQPENGEKFGTNFEIGSAPWNKKNKLLKIGIKTKEIDIKEAPAMNLTFLIDVSGSMREEKKLNYVKSSINIAVDTLRDKDKISIVTFSNIISVKLSGINGSEKSKIREAVNKITASGSTNGTEGLKKAYSVAKENYIKGGNNRIIIATDGDFNEGESSEAEIKELVTKERENKIYITALGYGTGNLKCTKLESIAKNGNGNMYYIDNVFESEKIFKKEMGKTLFTEAKDVKIGVKFNPEIVLYYRLIGYDSSVLGNGEFENNSKDSSEMGAGSSCTAFYEIETVEEIKELNKDICSITIKYKEPDDFSSNTVSKVLTENINYLKYLKEDSMLSNDFKFASAVAEFGLILRNSEYKKDAGYDNVIKRAKEGAGDSEDSSKTEFIEIVEKIKKLKE